MLIKQSKSHMKTAIFAVAISISLFSCTSNSYKQTANGIEYQYLRKSDSTKKVYQNSYLVLDVKYYTNKDSLLFNSDKLHGKFRMKYTGQKTNKKELIHDALSMMHVGDSMSFKIDAYDFFIKTRHDSCPKSLLGTKLRFEIALRDIQSETEVHEMKKEINSKQRVNEQILLKEFITNNYPDAQKTKSGLYFLPLTKGNGSFPKSGNIVTINYIGTFINGVKFDNTYVRKNPFTFTLGKNEVIEGLEEGVLLTYKGGKSVLIMPSSLAYGEEGKKPIPPNTSLIFQIELESVK